MDIQKNMKFKKKYLFIKGYFGKIGFELALEIRKI